MNGLMAAMTDVSETFEGSKNALMESFRQAFDQVIMLAPKVVAVLVVLVLGYVVARLVLGP